MYTISQKKLSSYQNLLPSSPIISLFKNITETRISFQSLLITSIRNNYAKLTVSIYWIHTPAVNCVQEYAIKSTAIHFEITQSSSKFIFSVSFASTLFNNRWKKLNRRDSLIFVGARRRGGPIAHESGHERRGIVRDIQ